MKDIFKKLAAAGLAMTLVLAASGCAGSDGDASQTGGSAQQTEEPKETLYPITINGAEILVGETKVQTLLDLGLKVTVSEMTPDKQINEYEIDPEQQLEAKTYYSGGSVWITENSFAHISLVTGDTPVRMGDAVIAYIEINISATERDSFNCVTINGVPANEITRAKAGEMFPDFKGDQNMWFKYGSEYKYSSGYNSDGNMTSFSASKQYDVDWTKK